MGRSIPRRSNSSRSCEGIKGACAELSAAATSYSSHSSRSLRRSSREGGHDHSCAGDAGGDHIGSSSSGRRRRNSSLSPSSSFNGSSSSKANYVKNYTSKRAPHHVEELGVQRRTHVRYHEQDEALFLARRSLSEPPLRFPPSSSSSSSSLERTSQRFPAHNHSFIAAQDYGEVLKYSSFSRSWRDSDGLAGPPTRKCNESGLGFCRALFDMFLALVLSLCGKKTICLRDLWNSRGCGDDKGSSKKEERGSGRMQLVTVSMLGSMDWVRVVVRSDASVRATIQAVLKAFASQKRLPPNGADPDAYHLHYSAFALQCLDSDELVENLGARNFVLCPRFAPDH